MALKAFCEEESPQHCSEIFLDREQVERVSAEQADDDPFHRERSVDVAFHLHEEDVDDSSCGVVSSGQEIVTPTHSRERH